MSIHGKHIRGSWIQHSCDDTGHAYFYSDPARNGTGATTWNEQDTHTETTNPFVLESKQDNHHNNNIDNELTPPWVTHMDDATNQPYYYSDPALGGNGDTKWDKPTLVQIEKVSSIVKKEDDVHAHAKENLITDVLEAALPPPSMLDAITNSVIDRNLTLQQQHLDLDTQHQHNENNVNMKKENEVEEEEVKEEEEEEEDPIFLVCIVNKRGSIESKAGKDFVFSCYWMLPFIEHIIIIFLFDSLK